MATSELEPSRARRATKKPAWLLDNVDPAQLVTGEVHKAPRQHQHKKSQERSSGAQQNEDCYSHQRSELPRRMCLNPACKSPFESPQWRRGPLGPGTLCNACGTRFARIEAKKKGDRKGLGKLRPQDLAEWQLFEQQLQQPLSVQQAWQAYAEHQQAREAAATAAAAAAAAAAATAAAMAAASEAASRARDDHQQLLQQQQLLLLQQHHQQLYDDEYEDTYDHGGMELQEIEPQGTEPYSRQPQDPAATVPVLGGDDELLCQEGLQEDDLSGTAAAPGAMQPGAVTTSTAPTSRQLSCEGYRLVRGCTQAGSLLSCRANLPAVPRQGVAGGEHRLQQAEPSSLGSGSPEDNCHSPQPEFGPALRPSRRRPRRYDDEAGCSDSQEAAACSYQESAHGCVSSRAGRAGQHTGGRSCSGEQFLHLLAVGEALIKAEGVAQEDRRDAWAEYVEKQLPTDQRKEGDGSQLPKKSRFGLEAVEAQGPVLEGDAAAHQAEQIQEAAVSRQGSNWQRNRPNAVGLLSDRPLSASVLPDRFEQLLAEAEQCIRARSASPSMLRGAQASSPMRQPVTAEAAPATAASNIALGGVKVDPPVTDFDAAACAVITDVLANSDADKGRADDKPSCLAAAAASGIPPAASKGALVWSNSNADDAGQAQVASSFDVNATLDRSLGS